MAQVSHFSAVHNRLLRALPPDNLAQLIPKLHPISLPVRKVLLVPQRQIGAVYFIESGWASVVAQLENGAQAEVGLIGYEGMVGHSLVLGVDTTFAETYMQAGGSGLQMDATAFCHETDENPNLRKLLLRYNDAVHAQTAQTAACNGCHALKQRFARWLLMAHDRSGDDNLSMTQDFLSMMLCVHRPSITMVAGLLQKAGIIRYTKGNILVLDRDALEASACECYKTVRDRFSYRLG